MISDSEAHGTRVPIGEIAVDPDLQPRVGGIDPNHVRELQESPDSWPPLTVVKTDGGHLLIDGFHRLAAAQNLALETVAIQFVELPGDGDLHSLAFVLNAQHGRPLSLADRRSFADRLLRQNAALSNMEISRRVGLSPTTVGSLRVSLEENEEIEPVRERVGADGSVYSVLDPMPQRKPGELPAQSLGSAITDAVGRIFTSAERREQRRIAHYLRRLALALDDQHQFEGWETAEGAVEACLAVLGPERAATLGTRLGRASERVLEVATALGHVEGSQSE